MSDPIDPTVPASPDMPPPAAGDAAAATPPTQPAPPAPIAADGPAAAPAEVAAGPAGDAAHETVVEPSASATDDVAPTGQAAAAETIEATATTEAPATGAGADGNRPAAPPLAPAATLALLKQHFPALFDGPAKPLKLRIQQDIQARAPGVFSRATLSAFFRRHTTSTAYLIGLTKSAQRFDLDGQPAGELSDEHKEAAQTELTRRRQVTREREQQAQAQQRTVQREAQRAEMAQQAEVMQARQARAALLRDFTRTTLTLANFCVLKGMTPEQLNPLLEQARKEAAEAPPVPPRGGDERRGPGGWRDDRPGPRPDSRRPRPEGERRDGPRADGQRPDPRGPRPDGRGPRRDGGRPPGRSGRGPGGQG